MLKQSAFFCVNLLVMQAKHKYQKGFVINHGFSLERVYKHCWRPLDCIPPYCKDFMTGSPSQGTLQPLCAFLWRDTLATSTQQNLAASHGPGSHGNCQKQTGHFERYIIESFQHLSLSCTHLAFTVDWLSCEARNLRERENCCNFWQTYLYPSLSISTSSKCAECIHQFHSISTFSKI